jgi:outer membrane murein-binding lipoprotein Lpp
MIAGQIGQLGLQMDTLHEQVSILSTQVEALTQRIEQLSSKVSEVATECKFTSEQSTRSDTKSIVGSRSYGGYGSLSASLEHKDILVDSDTPDSTTQSERQLAPEIQIQRLTAQLTAAYNRIAALEEQLLSKRVH